MCEGVEYSWQGTMMRIYFPNPKARLPVRKKDGHIDLITWGRRKAQIGELPAGGWARHESIEKGIWNQWQPRPVKIIVDRFMEKDMEGQSHWFELTAGQWIQGLMAQHKKERRVYVVTVTPEMPDAIYDRWPRIMNA